MEKPPIFALNYSLDFEKERIKYSFEKADWFLEHGYTVLFPNNLSIQDALSCGLEKLFKLAEKEYKEEYYAGASEILNKGLQWFISHWNSAMFDEIALSFEKKYSVFLTAYGVGGSYDVPNIIITNIRRVEHERLAVIVFHETIHLVIEPLIRQYKIPHWHKERLVDLYYKKIFPNKSFEQNLPKDVLSIDSIFEQYYKNPEVVVSEMAKQLV